MLMCIASAYLLPSSRLINAVAWWAFLLECSIGISTLKCPKLKANSKSLIPCPPWTWFSHKLPLSVNGISILPGSQAPNLGFIPSFSLFLSTYSSKLSLFYLQNKLRALIGSRFKCYLQRDNLSKLNSPCSLPLHSLICSVLQSTWHHIYLGFISCTIMWGQELIRYVFWFVSFAWKSTDSNKKKICWMDDERISGRYGVCPWGSNEIKTLYMKQLKPGSPLGFFSGKMDFFFFFK